MRQVRLTRKPYIFEETFAAHYLVLGLSMGAGLGIVAGLMVSNLALGLALGAGLGLSIGMLIDSSKSRGK
jgi:hypothetical protein